MNATVWKFKLHTQERQKIQVPMRARFLHAGLQGDEWFIWALCDPDADMEERSILIVPTGGAVAYLYQGDSYVNTVLHGIATWHIFAETSHADSL